MSSSARHARQFVRAASLALVLGAASASAGNAQTVAEAEAALAERRFDDAIAAFRAASATATQDQYRTFAASLNRARRGADAITILGLGVERFPDAHRFRWLIAAIHRDAGRCSEALRAVAPYVEADPTNADGWFVQADCLEQVGRAADARPAWERYVATEDRANRAADVERARAVLAGAPPAEAREAAQAAAAPAPAASPTASSPTPFGAAPAATTSPPATAATPGASAPVAGPAAATPASPFAALAPARAVSAPTVDAAAMAAAAATEVVPTFSDLATALAAASRAATERRWADAALAWRGALAFGEDGVIWYRLGLAEAVAGRTDRALFAFERAQTLDPGIPAIADIVARATTRVAWENAQGLDPAGFFTDPEVRATAARDAFLDGAWVAGLRAAADPAIDDASVDAARAAVEGRTLDAAVAWTAAAAERPAELPRWLYAADAWRQAGRMDEATWMLELYLSLGGDPAPAALVQGALQRASARAESGVR